MIIGKNFAIGHIPKCGGDAVCRWCAALKDDGLYIDSNATRKKHDMFCLRPEAMGKQHYILAIRRLPEWTMSLMQEDSQHPDVVRQWGFDSREAMLRKDAAFLQSYGDFLLSKMRMEVEITHWLRTGATLFEDLLEVLGEVYRPITESEATIMKAAVVKMPRPYCHDVREFWTLKEIETLYKLNPQWSAIENMVFGGLW